MFRRKKKAKATPDAPPLATNAPAHWPEIRRRLTGQPFVDQAALFAGLAQAGEDGRIKLRRIHRVRMFPDGLLTIPVEVEDGGDVRSVFLLAEPEQEARRWAGIRALLQKAGEPEPVYYAASAVPDAPAANPTRPFDYSLLGKLEKGPAGEFYMWCRTGDETWPASRARRDIRRFYEAVNGYETYHFAALLRGAGFMDGDAGRARLPEEPVDLPVELPGELTFYVTVSQEKGIQFKLPVDTHAKTRDLFWRHAAHAAEQMRGILQKHDVPRDADGDSEAFQWFSFADEVNAKSGTDRDMMRFGGLHVDA